MTVENALQIEIEKGKSLIEKVVEYRTKLEKEFPTWADVGDAKRFNALLQEIVEIYQYQK